MLARTAAERQIDLQWHCDRSLSKRHANTHVFGDWVRLEEIFLNLVSNALKYTPANSNGRVVVSVMEREHRDSERTLMLDIEVRDNGVGIPQESLPNIFEPFYQVPANEGADLIVAGVGGEIVGQRVRSDGAGVGLFIVSEVVKAMGGQIECQSELGRGTRFTVRNLRFDIGSEDATAGTVVGAISDHREHERITVALSQWSAEERAQVTVLLVEDNALNRRFMERLIRSCGFDVMLAMDGQQAVDSWKRSRDRIDLIFMDVEMPMKNGISATREIRELETQMMAQSSPMHMTDSSTDDARRRRQGAAAGPTPIVALTAADDPQVIEALKKAAITEFQSAPIDKKRLEECVWR
jgi:CheY-like chemotaxis protein